MYTLQSQSLSDQFLIAAVISILAYWLHFKIYNGEHKTQLADADPQGDEHTK